MIQKLTKKQIELQAKKRDEWINLALHAQNIDKEEMEAGVKWLYYISNLSEPNVVIVNGPKDLAKKINASVGASVWVSVRDSVWDSVGASVRDSVGDSVRASVRDSVGDSVGASVGASVWDSVRASVRASVWDSVRASVGVSVSWSCLSGDAEFGAWYEYWKEIKAIESQDKADKYVGFLRSGAFYVLLFEKVAFVMIRPTIVKQDESKRLHSEDGPALAFKDGTEIYKLHGVIFDKKWWKKIVEDKMTPQEILAIDNLEHRRIAWEYMNKKKLEGLKGFEVLDEQLDNKGNKMRVIQFEHPDAGKIRYYNCFCPTTGREYYIGTKESTCWEAKNASFGLKNVEWVDEW